MSTGVNVKVYDEPPICEREILRYAAGGTDDTVMKLVNSCIEEAREGLTYKICYSLLPVTVRDGVCDFGLFSVCSEKLAVNLNGCRNVLLFAATVGTGIDRLITKYGRIAPTKALMLQAIGAERIEALCDSFCEDIIKEKGVGLRPRFSPGYGDLPLECQRDIFAVLDCYKYIGLSLNSSLLMSPTKSVTAFAGITDIKTENKTDKCSLCDKKDCGYRGTL